MTTEITDIREVQRLTRWQYAEVRAFCRQYQEFKTEAAMLLGPRGQNYDPQPHGKGLPTSPVSDLAERREYILRSVHLIERAAQDVAEGRWRKALILNACYGVSWECLPTMTTLPSNHRGDFFRARRAYFFRLWELRMRGGEEGQQGMA